MKEQALKHLQELGAFDVSNPIVYKAITMRRLLDAGASYEEAKQSIEDAMKNN